MYGSYGLHLECSTAHGLHTQFPARDNEGCRGSQKWAWMAGEACSTWSKLQLSSSLFWSSSCERCCGQLCCNEDQHKDSAWRLHWTFFPADSGVRSAQMVPDIQCVECHLNRSQLHRGRDKCPRLEFQLLGRIQDREAVCIKCWCLCGPRRK